MAFAPRMAGLRDRAELDALVEQCLRQAALWDEVKDRLHLLGTKLSGGQQQRLTIARALVSPAGDPLPRRVLDRRRSGDDDEDRGRAARAQTRDDDRAGDEPGPAGPPAGRSTSRSSTTRALIEVGPTDVIFSEHPAQPDDLRLCAGALRMTQPGPTPGRTASQTRGSEPLVRRLSGAEERHGRHSRRASITGLDRTVGMRQDHVPALLQPAQRALRQRHDDGQNRRSSGKNIYDADVSLGELRKSVGMVFQRPNPLPISIYENIVFGLRVHSATGGTEPPSARRAGRVGAPEVAAVGRCQGPAATGRPRRLTLEQQQKLCIARLLPLKPQRHPDGRAVFGAGRRRHRRDRTADGGPEGTVTRSSSSRTTWRRPGGRATSAFSCCWAKSSNKDRRSTSF